MFSTLNIRNKTSSKGIINTKFTMLINSCFFGIISLLLLTIIFSSIIITISINNNNHNHNNNNFVSAQSYIAGPNVYWKIPSSISPREITWDPISNLFVIAGHGAHKIFTWDPATNAFATIAGSGSTGSFDSNFAGTSSTFRSPVGVTMLLGQSGSLIAYLVADTANSCLRRVEFSSPYLTSGLCGSCGDSGTETGSCGSAKFRSPVGMDYGQGAKEMYVADSSSHVVLYITFIGASSNRRSRILVGSADAAGTADGAATASALLYSPFAVAGFPRSASSSPVALFISTQGAGASLRRLAPVSSSSGVVSTIMSLGSSGSNKGFGLSHIFNSGTNRGYMLWWNDYSGLVYFDLNSSEAENSTASVASSNSQTIGFPCGNGGTNLIWPNFFDNNYSMLSILNSASSSSSDYDVMVLGDGACGVTTTSTTTTTTSATTAATTVVTTGTTTTTSTSPSTSSTVTTTSTSSPPTTTSPAITTTSLSTSSTTTTTTTPAITTTTIGTSSPTTTNTTTSTPPSTSSTTTTSTPLSTSSTTSTTPDTSSSTTPTTTSTSPSISSTTSTTPSTSAAVTTLATTSTSPSTSSSITSTSPSTASSTVTTATTSTTIATATPTTSSTSSSAGTTVTTPTPLSTTTLASTSTSPTTSSSITSTSPSTSSSTTPTTTSTSLSTTSPTATTATTSTSVTSATPTTPSTSSTSTSTTTSTAPATTTTTTTSTPLSTSSTSTSTPLSTTSSTVTTTTASTSLNTSATTTTATTSTSPSTSSTATTSTTADSSTTTPFVSSTSSSSSTTNPTGNPTNTTAATTTTITSTTTPRPPRTRSVTFLTDINNSSGNANAGSSAVLQLLATNGIRAWSTSLLLLSVIAVPPLSYLIQIFASISVISGASTDSKSTELYRLIFPAKVEVVESFASPSASNASSTSTSTTISSSSSLFTVVEILFNLIGLSIIFFGGLILNLIVIIAIYLWKRCGNNNHDSNISGCNESNDDDDQRDSSGHWLSVCSSCFFPSTVIILFSFCLPGLSFGAGFLIAEAANISNDNNNNNNFATCIAIAAIILFVVLVLFPVLLWKKTATGLEMLAQQNKIRNKVKKARNNDSNESETRNESQQKNNKSNNVTPEVGKTSSGNSSLAASQILIIATSDTTDSTTSKLINGEGERGRILSEIEWKAFPFVETTNQSIVKNNIQNLNGDSFAIDTDSRPCCSSSESSSISSSPMSFIITRGEFCGNFAQRWSAVLNIFSFGELTPFMGILHPLLAAVCCFLAGLTHLSDTTTIQNNNNNVSANRNTISIALSVVISALLFIFCIVMIVVRPYRRPLLVVFVVLISLATIFSVVEVAAVDFVGVDGLTFGQEQQNNNVNSSAQLGLLMIGTIICWISVIIMLIVVGFEYVVWRKYFVSANSICDPSATQSNDNDDDDNSDNSSDDDDDGDDKNARVVKSRRRRNLTSVIHVGSENSDDDEDDDDEETNFFRDDDEDEAVKNNSHQRQVSKRKIKIVRNPLVIPKTLHAKHGSNVIKKSNSSSSIDEEEDDDDNNKNESPRTRKEKIKFMKHVLGNTVVNLEASQNVFNNTASSKLSSNENNTKMTENVNDSLNSKLDDENNENGHDDDDDDFDVGNGTQRLRVLADCLAEWKVDFSATHDHREATVEDVERDPVASSLTFEYNNLKSSLLTMKKSRRKNILNTNNKNQNRGGNASGSPQRQMLDSFANSASFMWVPPQPTSSALQQQVQQQEQQLQKQHERQLQEYQEELHFLKNEQKPLKLKLHHFRTDFLRQYGKEPTNADYDKDPETKRARAEAASNASLIKSFTEKLEKLMLMLVQQQQQRTKNNQDGQEKQTENGKQQNSRPTSSSFGVVRNSNNNKDNINNNTNSSILASSSLSPEEIVSRKEHLGLQLVKWREQFSAEFHREPLVADMQAIPNIYSLYEEYLQLKLVIREKNLVEIVAAKSININNNNNNNDDNIKSDEEFQATQEKLQQTKKKINRWRRMFKAMNDNREPTDGELDLDPEMKTLVRSYVELKTRVGKAVSSGKFSDDRRQEQNNDEGKMDGNNSQNNKNKSERGSSVSPSKSNRSRNHRPSTGAGSSLNSSFNHDSGAMQDSRKFSASLVSTKCHDDDFNGQNILNASLTSQHTSKSNCDNNNNSHNQQQRPSSNSSNNNNNNSGRGDSRVRSPRTPGSRQQRRNHSRQREQFNGADYRHLALPERLKELNRALNRWKKNFVIEHGSAPTEDEMTRDVAVNNLYKEFVLVRKLNEDDETKKRLNRKLNVWRIQFKEKKGCAPTQDDLLNDPEIRSDYEEFLKIKEGITQREKQLADVVVEAEEQQKRQNDPVEITPATTDVVPVHDSGVTPPPPTRPSSSSEQQLQSKHSQLSSTRLEHGRSNINSEKTPFVLQQQQQSNFLDRLKLKIEAANAKDKLDRKRQRELRKEIVAWKEKFKLANGGLEATHADIEHDMSILGAYAEYLKLQFESKKKKSIFESWNREDGEQRNSSGMAVTTAEFVSSSNNMVDFSVKREEILVKLQKWEHSFFKQFRHAPTIDDFNADTTVKMLVETLRDQLGVDVPSAPSPSSPTTLSNDRRKSNVHSSNNRRPSDNRSRHAFDDDDDDDSDSHDQVNGKNNGKNASSKSDLAGRRRSFLMKQYDDDEVF